MPLTRRSARELGDFLRPYRPAVVQTHYLDIFSAALAALRRLAPALRPLRLLRGRWAGRRIDRMICVSEYVRRRSVAVMGFPGEKSLVVPNGIDLSRFSSVPEAPGEQAIAFAGQLKSEKGVPTLLRAAEILARERVPFRLRIAGEGPLASTVRHPCAEGPLAGRAEFLGQIDWVDRLFAGASLAVLPSEWGEAFGFVAAEAMACGTPVVASDAGASPEVVGSDGGVIFRRGDAGDLAAKVRGLLSDPSRRAALRASARQRVTRNYSLEQMVDGTARVLNAFFRSGDEVVRSSIAFPHAVSDEPPPPVGAEDWLSSSQ